MLLKCKTVYKKSVVRTLMAKKLGEKLKDGGEGAGGVGEVCRPFLVWCSPVNKFKKKDQNCLFWQLSSTFWNSEMIKAITLK